MIKAVRSSRGDVYDVFVRVGINEWLWLGSQRTLARAYALYSSAIASTEQDALTRHLPRTFPF